MISLSDINQDAPLNLMLSVHDLRGRTEPLWKSEGYNVDDVTINVDEGYVRFNLEKDGQFTNIFWQKAQVNRFVALLMEANHHATLLEDLTKFHVKGILCTGRVHGPAGAPSPIPPAKVDF